MYTLVRNLKARVKEGVDKLAIEIKHINNMPTRVKYGKYSRNRPTGTTAQDKHFTDDNGRALFC